MIGVVIGKVVNVELGKLIVEDHVSRELIECEADADDVLDIELGQQAIFVGRINHGKLKVRKLEIRKFLDPLYEEDLFDASGKFTLIPPIANPFTENFIEFMEKRKAIEEAPRRNVTFRTETIDATLSLEFDVCIIEADELILESIELSPASEHLVKATNKNEVLKLWKTYAEANLRKILDESN